jgi:cytochrome c oxidase subunit III
MNTAVVTSNVTANTGDAETARLGMWVFIASEVLFFGGLFVAYAYGRSHWPEGFAAAGRETHVVLGTLNTALLLTSSALVALAVQGDESGERRSWIPWLLWASAALGIAFIAVKGIEYRKEWLEHLVPGAGFRIHDVQGAELFFVLYFLVTGLHALHLTIGIAVLATFASGRRRAKAWASPRHVEVAGLYWHFVDIVWICLYPLLYLVGRVT